MAWSLTFGGISEYPILSNEAVSQLVPVGNVSALANAVVRARVLPFLIKDAVDLSFPFRACFVHACAHYGTAVQKI
jgi:hypothetical protein